MLRAARSRAGGWHVLVPLVGITAGLLLVATANTARGTDLRAARSLEISQRIAVQQREQAQLSADERRVREQISAATVRAAASDERVRSARAAADRMGAAAGLTPVTGSAVTVRLDDAPRARAAQALSDGARPDDLVIHEQDVQAVVNALWAGGASALAIMDERVVATTAVRCVGNTLLLHGRVYSPPFLITALGDPGRLRAALEAAPALRVFRQYVAAYGLGYEFRVAPSVTLPGFAGPLQLPHARPR